MLSEGIIDCFLFFWRWFVHSINITQTTDILTIFFTIFLKTIVKHSVDPKFGDRPLSGNSQFSEICSEAGLGWGSELMA